MKQMHPNDDIVGQTISGVRPVEDAPWLNSPDAGTMYISLPNGMDIFTDGGELVVQDAGVVYKLWKWRQDDTP